jgi:inhibitor of KinA
MADPPAPRIVPMGDRALVVEFGDTIDPALSTRIAALAKRLRAECPPGVHDIVPTYATLAVHYDPAALGCDDPYEVLAEQVGTWLESRAVHPEDRGLTFEIPVCYGGDFGTDLAELARRHGLEEAEVARLHSAPEYHVHMLGFVPGFAYLGGLDARLATPRRDAPRARVPAGSVAIGGAQTGVFPLETPGGWHLIGRTPLRLFVADAEPPCLLNAGDRVRFVPIDAARFDALARNPSA